MSHAHRLKRTIEDEIVDGHLRPGDRLDEAQLADRFGVSRTPIREALIQLAATGLIELRPRRTTVVSIPTPQQLYEMFETMAEMEASCGRLATRRLTGSSRQELETALGRCRTGAEGGDTEAYYLENHLFHSVIYTASRNEFLADQALRLSRRLAPFRRLQLRAGNRLAQSLAEHEGIVAAILQGDAELAAGRLHAHVLVQGDRFSGLIQNLKTMSAAA